MSEENKVEESLVVQDIKAFDTWYEENLVAIMGNAKESGLDVKLRPILRMAWRKCCDIKNREVEACLKEIQSLKIDIALGDDRSEGLRSEVERLTNRVISLEKAVKNIK